MKYLVIAVMVMLLAVSAYAAQTGGATYSSPNGEVDDCFIDFLNEQDYIDHTHNAYVDEGNDPYGVGADVIVWENENKEKAFQAVEIQAKYDIPNEEVSGYVVAKFNIASWFKQKAKAE